MQNLLAYTGIIVILDALFRERENLNVQIVQALNSASEAWGIQCMR
jgi:hypothetical protein